MLYLRRRKLDTVEDLRSWLLGAVRLELSTIPPYLTALYSIMPGTNADIAGIIRHVAVQEMLHMCLACNVLNAVGGRPTLNDPGFRPAYPGPLPMGIGTEPGRPFIVPLKRFSLDLVQSVFMVIEEPDDPLKFPVKRVAALAEVEPEYHTIGDFYRAVEAVIVELGPSIFTGDPRRQVKGWFPADELFPVVDRDTARAAIDVIVSQGEGTKTGPLDVEGGLAHYYLYSEIGKGRRLVKDPSAPEGYSYSGAPIAFDPSGVFPMVDNPTQVVLPAGSLVSRLANQFDQTYTALLNALQATVDGDPSQLGAAIGLMYALRIEAQQLMATPIPGGRGNAGPRWQFVTGYASG
jgi:Ferritin-like